MTACALPKYGCLSKEVTVENPYHSEAKEVPFILPRKNNLDSDDDNAEVSLIKSMLLPLYDVHYMMYSTYQYMMYLINIYTVVILV